MEKNRAKELLLGETVFTSRIDRFVGEKVHDINEIITVTYIRQVIAIQYIFSNA